MAVWSEVNFAKVGRTTRFDAEFYRPDYLQYEAIVEPGEPLSSCATISHPTEIKRVYEESGIQILLAQNVRPNRLNFSTAVYMPFSVEEELERNRLEFDDIVMTRSGANFGDTAVYKGEPEVIYACADVLIIRPNNVLGGYLSTFFNTSIGRSLLTRGAYGAAQPHIAPNYLNKLRLPRVGEEKERAIDSLILAAYLKEREASAYYNEAENILLHHLELDTLDHSHELTYERNFSEVAEAGRFDAQFFAPRYQRAMKIIARSGQTLGSVAPLAKRLFCPEANEPFNYIEIGNLIGNGRAESEIVMGEDAPSRAQWIVEAGDVITSTVRPIRRLTALIKPEQHGFVCSSGFAVLKPRDISPELLTVYLRLPIVSEVLDLHTTATMYPAIATDVLLSIPISQPSEAVTTEIVSKVRQSHEASEQANQILQDAKQLVEQMILGR